MGLGNPRRDGASHPGEPGIGVDLGPPFTAPDEDTAWLFALNRFGIRPGLARIEGLLADLGHPERELRTLVVAGTNGKGSTTRALTCLLQAAGHRTATYTSPHLLNVYERIHLEDRPVEADEFRRRVREIRPLTEKHEASWFETLTALCVWMARDAGVDYLCCETGLGGRLDASNALPAIATLLTTVDLDHQRILGETREEIAAEKLGLLKRGVPLFCGVDEDLRAQVFRAAILAGSPAHYLDELAEWETAPEGWTLKLTDRMWTSLPDPGSASMRRNVALAILALSRLQASRDERLLPDDVPAALADLFLPGRYQTVLQAPDWIFDTAHNRQALTSTLTAFAEQPGAGRRILLFGAMYDKEIPAGLAAAVRHFDLVLGVPVSLPRSRNAGELAEVLRGWGREPVAWPPQGGAAASIAPDPATALAWLDGQLDPQDRVLVTGSCFTVAEVLYRLGITDLEMTRRPIPYARRPAAGA